MANREDLGLDGAVAVVTGGASGIGRAITAGLTAAGATVGIVDRDPDTAAATAAEIGAAWRAGDVSDADSTQGAVEGLAAEIGSPTILVNNAGAGTLAMLHETDPRRWDLILRVNLTGVFHGFRAVVPHMLRAGDGAIVSIASISGMSPAAGEGAYAATKAGIIALTRAAALEYGPVIRVNAVSPGMTQTAMAQPAIDERKDALVRATPLQRIGEPRDIANAVVFLCSDHASFITGQNLAVDGGITLHGSGMDGALEERLGDWRARLQVEAMDGAR